MKPDSFTASQHNDPDEREVPRLPLPRRGADEQHEPSRHPHVDRHNAGARAEAISAGHSVACAEFGNDAACPGPSSASLVGLHRAAANALELYALERQWLAAAAIGKGDPGPLVGLVESARRGAVGALRALGDAVWGAAGALTMSYAGALLTCDTTLDEDEQMVRDLRAEMGPCDDCDVPRCEHVGACDGAHGEASDG